MDHYQALLNHAFRILAQRKYTVSEMQKKLEAYLERYATRKKQSLDQGLSKNIETVINRLKELEYLNDETFASLYIDDCLRKKPQGLKMIRNKLIKKGISTSILAKAFQGKDLNEKQIANIAIEKKLKTIFSLDPRKQKEKLYRFLMSRGFSIDTIFKVLD